MSGYDEWKTTDPHDEELGSNPKTSSEWFGDLMEKRDSEISRLKKLIPLAFAHGIETACDFYDNGMPKHIAAQALAKWKSENGLT